MATNLNQVLLEQRENLLKKPLGIERTALEEARKKAKLPHAVVITGIRRCGKSTLLRQIAKKLYNDNDFYYINFEDERLLSFKAEEFNKIYESQITLFGEQKTFLIDEIQNIDKFETFVRRFTENGFKFYISGSNAKLLSKELGTKLTGRHVDITLKPFSFKEYLKLKGIQEKKEHTTEETAQIKKHFNTYLENGGMPEYATYQDDEILKRIYEDIIIKDIAVRQKVENVTELRELYFYLISNFSSKFSYNSLRKIVPLSINTIKKYIGFLEDTYLAKTITKFEHSTKKQLINDKKLYPIDNGFIKIITTKTTKDKGWLIENLIFNNLKGTINYFTDKKECDFITLENKQVTSAIQATYELNQNNREREISGLINAMTKTKARKGTIITYEQEEQLTINKKKITILPAWKWLLNF